MPAPGRDASSGASAHDLCDPLATSKRGEMARHREDLGPWWQAAQIFILRARGWERLLDRVQERGVTLGMVFLDGSNVQAHQKM